VLEFIKARNGEKNCPARRNRKREDSDDLRKEIALLQTSRRSSKERQSQPFPDLIPLSRENDFRFSLTMMIREFLAPVREDAGSCLKMTRV
jgi:hypothetical protein